MIQNLPLQSKVAVLTQDNPDPDAMGLAFAISYLCRHLNPDIQGTDIFYGLIAPTPKTAPWSTCSAYLCGK